MKRKNKGSYINAIIVALFAAMIMIAFTPTTAFCATDSTDDTDTVAGGEVTEAADGTSGGVGQSGATDEGADGTAGGVGQSGATDEDADGTYGGVEESGATDEDADGTYGGVEESGVTDEGADGDNDTAESNLFTAIYEAVGEYSGEILSALAFIGSIIIMICYKSGLLPIVKEGLLALMSGVKSLGEHSGNIASCTEQMKEEIAKECLRTEELLITMQEALATIEKKLGDEAARTSEIAAMKNALTCEVDMIYDVFMAAALPQYLKDKVGETARNMKATLGEGERDDGKK